MLRFFKALSVLALAFTFAQTPAYAGDNHAKHDPKAHAGEIAISGAWIRAGLPNRPTAGYLMLKNTGAADDRLLEARSPAFKTIELHESKMEDGVMKMAPITAVEIAAGGMAMLEPGGKHLMMFGGKDLSEGTKIEVTLVFEKAGEVTMTVPVVKRAGGHKHGKHKE